jgi:hypothetical protein
MAIVLPRFIRVRDAPPYVGMARGEFNEVVRPYLTEIPIGRQGKAFDRLDLDAWADWWKEQNGKPPKVDIPSMDAQDALGNGGRPRTKGGRSSWGAKACSAFTNGTAFGTSTSASEASADFGRVLERVTGRKPKRI